MEYLQYSEVDLNKNLNASFKPYYKWNTFNTMNDFIKAFPKDKVLNLIINGIPSILEEVET